MSVHSDGMVQGVSSDAQHAFSKPARQHITLIENQGVEGDAHAGKHVRHRFIARPCALIERFRKGLMSKMISGASMPKFKGKWDLFAASA